MFMHTLSMGADLCRRVDRGFAPQTAPRWAKVSHDTHVTKGRNWGRPACQSVTLVRRYYFSNPLSGYNASLKIHTRPCVFLTSILKQYFTDGEKVKSETRRVLSEWSILKTHLKVTRAISFIRDERPLTPISDLNEHQWTASEKKPAK